MENEVLFDPFTDNDLFTFSAFKAHGKELAAADAARYEAITAAYEAHMRRLSPLRSEPRYAVQGDISDGNLYRTGEGGIGVFDFNRCGDNDLYCDAVMQAVFEARLMDYPEHCAKDPEAVILPAFLRGYHRERPFTQRQRELYPYLYAVIDAFWSQDILWREESLTKELERGNTEGVRRWLNEIYRRICSLTPMPLQREKTARI